MNSDKPEKSDEPERVPQWTALPPDVAEEVKRACAESGIPLTPEQFWGLTHPSEAVPIEQLLIELDEMLKQGGQGAA
jgi:hypothetical protein